MKIQRTRLESPTHQREECLLAPQKYRNGATALSKMPKLSWGDIRVDRFLGRGGFCSVFAASTFSTQEDLVVKLVNTDDKNDRNLVEMDLIHEAKILAKLPCHENIIRLFGVSDNFTIDDRQDDTYTIDGAMFLVMNRLEYTLADEFKVWRESTTPSWRTWRPSKQAQWKTRVQNVALGVVDGLRFLHQHGVVHRDIKPANIGFDMHHNVVLFDFGLAREVGHSAATKKDEQSHPINDEDSNDGIDHSYECGSDNHPDEEAFGAEDEGTATTGTTATADCSGPAGTVRYMSPEIARSKKYGVSADIYSFGMLLWELITLGNPLSQYKTKDAILHASSVQGKRPPLRKVPHKDLRKLIRACWEDDASRRPTACRICDRLNRLFLSQKEQPVSSSAPPVVGGKGMLQRPQRKSLESVSGRRIAKVIEEMGITEENEEEPAAQQAPTILATAKDRRSTSFRETSAGF